MSERFMGEIPIVVQAQTRFYVLYRLTEVYCCKFRVWKKFEKKGGTTVLVKAPFHSYFMWAVFSCSFRVHVIITQNSFHYVVCARLMIIRIFVMNGSIHCIAGRSLTACWNQIVIPNSHPFLWTLNCFLITSNLFATVVQTQGGRVGTYWNFP